MTLNRFAYCLNDPINRMDKDGQWSLFKSLQKVVTAAGALIGNTIEVAIDVVVTIVEIGVNLVQTAMDTASRFMDDVKRACDYVADAVVSGCQAVQRAWDNLDPGLKQWIITGVSMAVSFAILLSLILFLIPPRTFT